MVAMIEDNLGIFRENPDGSRVLLETQRPLGTYTVFTSTGYLGGAFLILPSNSAPRIKAAAASPLVFSPDNLAMGRPKTEIFLSVQTAVSPSIYVTAEIVDLQGASIRVIARDVPVALALLP